VIVTNIDGIVQLCNKTAERMFGIPAEQMIGRDVGELTAPPRLRAAMAATYREMARSIARDRPCTLSRRTLAQRADGEVFPIELAVTNDMDSDGQPIVIGFARDISAQVKAERALRDALDEARRAAAAKSMFLATMSHEMRTPLHGLIAALELMDKSRFDAETQALHATARDCSDRALAQVNDVLNFTRATSIREMPRPFRPARIARELVSELGPFARERGNTIEVAVHGEGADTRVMGYPDAFSRALYNLLGNAVKFTEAGRITVRLDFDDRGPAAPLGLTVSVIDEGPGITEADQRRIFRMFETSAQPGATLAGTGLGLPIAQFAAECMGSQIRVDSRIGEGSRFWFALELPRIAEGSADLAPPPLPEAEGPAPALPPQAVLVVDDNDVNLTLMVQMVRRLGHATATARNGQEAVAAAMGRAFDVILMDVNMPVMDGRAATQAIRAGGPSAEAVIIGVTALMEAEDPDHFAEIGMDMALVKPVTPAALARALAATLSARAAEAEDAGDDADSGPAPAQAVPPPALDAAGLDLAALAAMVGEDTARRLVAATLADARVALAAGRAADPETGRLAHKAAGAASSIGWGALGATLLAVEMAVRAGGPAAAAAHLPALDQAIAAAAAGLPSDYRDLPAEADADVTAGG
jgi:PAS domain S-box-containing protein